MSEEEKQVADACDALLATIIARSEPHLQRASETLYDHLLSGVQTYLVENAHWNLGNEIRRCAEINRRNAELVETTHRLELQQQRLLAALRPFAAHADYWDNAVPEQPVHTSLKRLQPKERDDTGNATIFVRDLRAARSAIAKAEGSEQ
jgi:hypothetical protein